MVIDRLFDSNYDPTKLVADAPLVVFTCPENHKAIVTSYELTNNDAATKTCAIYMTWSVATVTSQTDEHFLWRAASDIASKATQKESDTNGLHVMYAGDQIIVVPNDAQVIPWFYGYLVPFKMLSTDAVAGGEHLRGRGIAPAGGVSSGPSAT